jgi:hypothetical protein
VFRERGTHGHAFFRLQDDTEELKWRVLREFESGNPLARNHNTLGLADFCQKIEELERLSRLVRDALRLTERIVDEVVDQDAWTSSREATQLLQV